jgi:flagellar FliJ protein
MKSPCAFEHECKEPNVMKPFTFRLQRLLNYRGYLERRAQVDLFNAKNEVRAQEEEIKKLKGTKMDIWEECSDEGARGMNVPLYQIYRSFINKLDLDLEEAHRRLEALEEKVKAQTAVLREETIRKKTLENLKDLQRKRYMVQTDREEQKEMDEMVILRKGAGH